MSDYLSQLKAVAREFKPYNQWAIDQTGPRNPDGSFKYIIDCTTGNRYLRQPTYVIQLRFFVYVYAASYYHYAAAFAQIILKIRELITSPPFWIAQSGESAQDFAKRAKAAVLDIGAILGMSLVRKALKLVAIYGIFNPYDGQKLYAKLERIAFNKMFFLAPDFQPQSYTLPILPASVQPVAPVNGGQNGVTVDLATGNNSSNPLGLANAPVSDLAATVQQVVTSAMQPQANRAEPSSPQVIAPVNGSQNEVTTLASDPLNLTNTLLSGLTAVVRQATNAAIQPQANGAEPQAINGGSAASQPQASREAIDSTQQLVSALAAAAPGVVAAVAPAARALGEAFNRFRAEAFVANQSANPAV